MDIRDFQFWTKQAQKKLIIDQIKNIQACRLAMDEGKHYNDALSEYQAQLRELEVEKEVIIKENWNDLKMLRRKK